MSLNKEAQKKILKALKFSDADITKLVDGTDEVDATIPDTVKIFTAEELTTRDTSISGQSKADALKEGEKQGKELATKAIKKKFNITDETKDWDRIADIIQTNLAKGDDGLKEQIKLLQTQVSEKEAAIVQEKTAAQQAIFDAQLLASLPQNRKSVEEGGFTDGEYLAAIKANLKFEHSDNGVIVKKGDQVYRDPKTTNPLPVQEVLKTYMDERKWTANGKGSGGRGGSDSGGGSGAGGIKTMSKLQEQWLKDNPEGNIISPEFTSHVAKVMKETPDFKSYE